MVHRSSRTRLAEALRHYAAGLITNDELDAIDVDWRDRGAVAAKERAWGLYDDNYEHRAEGRHYLMRASRREIARWILFLHSANEYLWPEYSFMQIVNWPLNLVTLGWWERRKEQRFAEFREAGDFSVWPFVDSSEFRAALDHPRLLAKHALY